jgi:hypothetical protein
VFCGVNFLFCLIKKSTEALLDASKEAGVEVNAEKTKYVSVSHHQTTGQNHYIRLDLRFSRR